MTTPSTLARWARARTVLVMAAASSLLVTTAATGTAAPASSSEPAATPVGAAPVAAAAAAPTAADVDAVTWAPCGEAVPGFDCATYEVPLDHADPGSPGLQLALVRLPATDTENRIGSLFLNPGGPGGSGVGFAVGAGEQLNQLTQGRFDVVGFDPRGVNASAPVRCFASTAEAVLALPELGIDVVPDSPDEVVERTATTAAYTDLCGQRNADLLPYVSTEAVARDLDLLRAAVGDEQLTYYGISYGTMLGQTYANLFPDRVRALALDGVIDPVEYTADVTTFLRGSLVDADQTFEEFFDTCEAAGPERCALAGKDGRAVARGILETIRRDGPLPALGARIPGTVGEDDLVGLVFNLLYSPATWPALAQALDVASTGDGSALLDLALVGTEDLSPDELLDLPYSNARDALTATLCNDTGDDGAAADWPAAAQRTALASGLFGPYNSWAIGLPCATWPAEAASRYTGPWDAQTANPVLLIGTTADPITPLTSAETVAALLPGSRLLVHDGLGHTSIAAGQTSTCSLAALRGYLVEQRLPAEGTVCQPDSAPFDPAPGPAEGMSPRGMPGVDVGPLVGATIRG